MDLCSWGSRRPCTPHAQQSESLSSPCRLSPLTIVPQRAVLVLMYGLEQPPTPGARTRTNTGARAHMSLSGTLHAHTRTGLGPLHAPKNARARNEPEIRTSDPFRTGRRQANRARPARRQRRKSRCAEWVSPRISHASREISHSKRPPTRVQWSFGGVGGGEGDGGGVAARGGGGAALPSTRRARRPRRRRRCKGGHTRGVLRGGRGAREVAAATGSESTGSRICYPQPFWWGSRDE